jgi:hypothetical protein
MFGDQNRLLWYRVNSLWSDSPGARPPLEGGLERAQENEEHPMAVASLASGSVDRVRRVGLLRTGGHSPTDHIRWPPTIRRERGGRHHRRWLLLVHGTTF